MRNIFYIAFLLLFSCSNNNEVKEENSSSSWMHLEGEAQGTTFSIKYEDKEGRSFSKEVKEIFDEMDQQLSTYIEDSDISLINRDTTSIRGINESSEYFLEVLSKSKQIYNTTEGAFNPAVYSLVAYWGFGKKAETPEEINPKIIDSLLGFLHFDSVGYHSNKSFISCHPKMKFDFFGIAQGYTVDIIAEFLESKGVKNYMVEVGGEVRAKGKNERNLIWNLGIEKPSDINAKHELQATIKLNNRSMATSGNYRKFYEKNGVRYSHTIDPKTGYPVQHSLLSATILAPDCASADAYATVFMVMGLEKGKEFLKNHPELNLDAYLIYSEKGEFKTWTSKGIKDLIEEAN